MDHEDFDVEVDEFDETEFETISNLSIVPISGGGVKLVLTVTNPYDGDMTVSEVSLPREQARQIAATILNLS